VSARPVRGWAAVFALALVCLTLSVVQPALVIFVPLALLLLGLPPRRAPAVLAAALLLTFVFVPRATGAWWYAERGWALVLGAWFLAIVVLLPGARFVTRGLVAVVGALGSTVLWLAARGGLAAVDGMVTDRLRRTVHLAVEAWGRSGPLGRVLLDGAAVERFIEIQAMLYPAQLGLASLAGLAVAWWAYGRLSARIVEPLAPLRDFRFDDGLVWVVILALVLLVLPLDGVPTRAATNALLFMGALYALRGAAVVLVVAGGLPGPLGTLLGAVMLVLLYPIVMAGMVLVGLTDTWLDIRARRAAAPP
jgi:hypothetical protein